MDRTTRRWGLLALATALQSPYITKRGGGGIHVRANGVDGRKNR